MPKINQELSIFGQTLLTGNNDVFSLAGLQYRRWHNEQVGFRVIGAFGQYYSSGGELQYISGDKVITRQQHYNISLPVVGFGLEAQRHFYKRVSLFAAVELRGGYGAGHADTGVSRSIGQGAVSQYLSERSGRRDVSLLYLGLSPSIGAKMQWSRLCVSLEIAPLTASYTQLYNAPGNGGTINLDMGNLNQRLSIGWRF